MDSNQETSGSDSVERYTREDEEKMDRAAQAGVEGAFEANPEGEETRESMREDAEDAFSDSDAGGSGQSGG